jgi:hypothetical protein
VVLTRDRGDHPHSLNEELKRYPKRDFSREIILDLKNRSDRIIQEPASIRQDSREEGKCLASLATRDVNFPV